MIMGVALQHMQGMHHWRNYVKRYYIGAVLSDPVDHTQAGSQSKAGRNDGVHHLPVCVGSVYGIPDRGIVFGNGDQTVKGALSFYDTRHESSDVPAVPDGGIQPVFDTGGNAFAAMEADDHERGTAHIGLYGDQADLFDHRVLGHDFDDHAEQSDGWHGKAVKAPTETARAGT